MEQRKLSPEESWQGVKQAREVQRQMAAAREILGKDNVFGQEEVEKALGMKLFAAEILPMPFSREDLERARREDSNACIFLQIDKTSDGQPLTMEKIAKISKDFVIDPSVGRTSAKAGESETGKNEAFYKTETPRAGWALVSGKTSRPSMRESCLDQTRQLAAESRNFLGENVPKEYLEAFEELKNYKGGDDAAELAGLKINQLLRRRPVEAVYHHVVAMKSKGRASLPEHEGSVFEVTCTHDTDNMIVDVSILGYPPKIAVSHIRPDGANPIVTHSRPCRRS